MVMIGIKAIGRYIGSEKVSNLARSELAGKDSAFISDKIGFESLARLPAQLETSDMCVSAFADLQRTAPLRKDDVDCLIVCTQNPDAHGLPHTSAIVHKKLGLKYDVACFDVSLGCSGYVYGLSVIDSFMRANNMRCGLLFTADPYSRIIDPHDWDTELLFGDAATVTWVGADPIYRCRSATFGTDGSLGHSIAVSAESGKLGMLGSNVFKFSMTVVPEQIDRYLDRESLSRDDIDVFLFHQGSRFIVENLAKKMRLPMEKVPFEATDVGNTVSSSLPLLLQPRLQSVPGRILMSGFGVGLSWATIILEVAHPQEMK
jgi:3-oxoacyl-[acyl-carrier-protein] synthase-3